MNNETNGMKKKHARHSKATHKKVLRLVKAGLSRLEIQRKTGVSPGTIAAWSQKANGGANVQTTPRVLTAPDVLTVPDLEAFKTASELQSLSSKILVLQSELLSAKEDLVAKTLEYYRAAQP